MRHTGEASAGGPPPDAQLTWNADWPPDIASILGPLAHGRADPTTRVGPDGAWRATRNTDGPATVHYRAAGAEVTVMAWGPGAAAEVSSAPAVLGAGDDPAGFDWAAHPLMARSRRPHGLTWRVPRTGRALESLVPAILEQRVTGRQARTAWTALVGQHGSPAPGPGAALGLLLAPTAPGWVRVPSWDWHRAGVDPGRARRVVQAAERADAVERLALLPPATARAALTSIPGVGPWTAAEVAVRAWGDIDAVSFGDFHLGRVVTYNLCGRTDGDDASMAELLLPWAGQRARAVRMIELVGSAPPRRGPRATITDHRHH